MKKSLFAGFITAIALALPAHAQSTDQVAQFQQQVADETKTMEGRYYTLFVPSEKIWNVGQAACASLENEWDENALIGTAYKSSGSVRALDMKMATLTAAWKHLCPRTYSKSTGKAASNPFNTSLY